MYTTAPRSALLSARASFWLLSGALVFSGCESESLLQVQPILRVQTQEIDFGAVVEGESVVRTVRLENPAAAPLEDLFLDLDASSSPDFALLTRTSTLGPSSRLDVEIRFSPSDPGSDSGQLIVRSAFLQEQEVSVALRGGPIAPELVITPDPIDFGPAETATVTRSFDVRNEGQARLVISDVFIDPEGNQDFVLRDWPTPIDLAPGTVRPGAIDYIRSGRANAGRLVVQTESEERTIRLLPDPLRACQDGEDNDDDGLIDFPDDPGCASDTDDDEANPPECDDGDTEVCGRDVGACSTGMRTCANRIWGPCEGDVEPTNELCDNIDNDCDGRTDEEVTGTCDLNGCAGARVCIEASGVDGGAWEPCIPILSEPETCDGADNDCNGQVDDGIVEACVFNGCMGTRICVPGGSGEYTTCQVTPELEVCNGVDDDCNGVPDDGLADLVCGQGVCQRTALACVNGQPGVCTPGAPGVESCNGLDDDCNGTPDDLPTISCGVGQCARTVAACTNGAPNTCTPGTPSPETCNGLDDDCDGTPDNGLSDLSCGVGECARTVLACMNGTPNMCVPGPSNPEICNGLDDDCDGAPDDGLGNVSCGVGQCARTVEACTNGSPNPCVPGPSSPEVCNGLDDNCNGAADDGLGNLSCGTGECARTVAACTNGTPNTCVPGPSNPEACNGLDDDCDGLVDDGLGNLSCGVGQCARTVQACTNGSPNTCVPGPSSPEACNGLDDDCNGIADDGLADLSCGVGECARTVAACTGGMPNTCVPGPSNPETCNGLDDNCDGAVDEGGVCTAMLCPPNSTAADLLEPNDTFAASNPIVPPVLGSQTYTYDITIPAGDEDWIQFNFPPPFSASMATMTAEVTCVSWGTQAGCPATPTLGLAAWYFDDVCTPGGQQDDFDTGTSAPAFVTSSGPVSPFGFCVPQKFRLRAFPTATICAGEAINARIEVTVSFQ